MRGKQNRKARRTGEEDSGGEAKVSRPKLHRRRRAHSIRATEGSEQEGTALLEDQEDMGASTPRRSVGAGRGVTSRDRRAYAREVRDAHRRDCLWCERGFLLISVVMGTDTHQFCSEKCAYDSMQARERGTWEKDARRARRARLSEVKTRMRVARAARGGGEHGHSRRRKPA